jgi:dihydrofolate reductase
MLFIKKYILKKHVINIIYIKKEVILGRETFQVIQRKKNNNMHDTIISQYFLKKKNSYQGHLMKIIYYLCILINF